MSTNVFTGIINALERFTLGDFLDILLVTFIVYSFLRLIKDSKAYQMAIGLGLVLVMYIVTQWAQLNVSHQIIKGFTTYLIIAIIVLFQGEIRRFLTSIGSQTFRRPLSFLDLGERLEDIFLAVDYLSSRKIGALIAIEKEISLKSYIDRGTRINADLSRDLLASLFFPHSPLHDGAVILQQNKIAAAGCLLPLPDTHKLGIQFKTRTRHLAALGLSQETDAAVIVVSEETGIISLATEGALERGLDKHQLKNRLLNYLG